MLIIFAAGLGYCEIYLDEDIISNVPSNDMKYATIPRQSFLDAKVSLSSYYHYSCIFILPGEIQNVLLSLCLQDPLFFLRMNPCLVISVLLSLFYLVHMFLLTTSFCNFSIYIHIIFNVSKTYSLSCFNKLLGSNVYFLKHGLYSNGVLLFNDSFTVISRNKSVKLYL